MTKMECTIHEGTDRFSVYPKHERQVVEITIQANSITRTMKPYSQFFPGAGNPSIFDARYEGDDLWDIDADAGARRWSGKQNTDQVRQALAHCGFGRLEIKHIIKKYKVEPPRDQSITAPQRRGDPYANVKSQAWLLDGSTWKVLNVQPDNFHIITRMYGPLENSVHERDIKLIPNDMIVALYRDDGEGMSWQDYDSDASHLWRKCWQTFPRGLMLRFIGFDEAVETASYWHIAIGDPIYAFSSTGCIQSVAHRFNTMDSIARSIKWTCEHWESLPLVWTNGDDGGPNSKHDLVSLLNLLLYVANAPIQPIIRD